MEDEPPADMAKVARDFGMQVGGPPILDKARYGLTFVLAIVLVIWLIAGPEKSMTLYLVVIDLLGGLLVVAATWSARMQGPVRRGAPTVAAIAVAASIFVSFESEEWAMLTSAIVMLAVAVFVPIVVVIGLARRGRIDLQLVLGAITIYLVTGLASSMAFAIASQVQSTPTLDIYGTPGDGDFRSQVYLSFVTLATVGYGDITPYSGTARAIAIFTALFGQLYLVTAVAASVSLLSAARMAKHTEE